MPTVHRKNPLKKTKWELKRLKRPEKRIRKSKIPLAEPLTIASTAKRNAALKKGKLIFYDGKKPVVVNLFSSEKNEMSLQGIYKTSKGRYITLRFTGSGFAGISLFELKKTPIGWIELSNHGSVSADPNLGHMILPLEIRGESLGLKAVSKAERNVRAMKGKKHRFKVRLKFGNLFMKLGYEIVKRDGMMFVVEKSGKHQPKDDLNKFHRIEAIDPKTGKARIFTFKIQGE